MSPKLQTLTRGAVLLLALLALMGTLLLLSGQEPCASRNEWQIPGVVKDVATHTTGAADWKISPTQVSKIVSQARELIDLLLRLDFVAHPKGMQVGYYRAIGTPAPGKMTLEIQPYPLHVEAMVFGFRCINGKVQRRWTDADAGITIDVNSLFDLLDNTGAVINGKQAFMLHLDLGEYRGYRLFRPYTNRPLNQNQFDRSILVTRPGQLPFTYVTRKELLDHMRAEVERAAPVEAAQAASTVNIRPREEQEADKKRQIEQIQGYRFSEESKKKRIDRFLADYKMDEQLRDEAVARIKAIFEARRKRLDTLQADSKGAQLQEPAVIPAQSGVHYSLLDSEGWNFVSPKINLSEDCSPPCKFGQYLVALNENYYDKSLPPTAFQVFVVTVGAMGNPEKLYCKKLLFG